MLDLSCLAVLLFSVPSGAQEQMPSYEMPIERLDELLMAERPPLLIDLRSPQAYMRIHIPNSLNIQPFALTSKAFLRGNALLLIDDGFHPARLEQLCRQLSERPGLDARYLSGGLLAWQSAGHRLQGDVFAHAGALTDPAEGFARRTARARLAAHRRPSAAPSGLFPAGRVLSLSGSTRRRRPFEPVCRPRRPRSRTGACAPCWC